MNRVPSADKINRRSHIIPEIHNPVNTIDHDVNTSSRVDLRNSKSAYRIMSTTQQNFSMARNESMQSATFYGQIERAKTAKGGINPGQE